MENGLFGRSLITLLPALKLFRSSAVIGLVVLATACSSLVGDTPTETGSVPQTVPATETEESDCEPGKPGTGPVDTGSVATNALFLSGELFVCADDVVVVAEDDVNEVAAAAQLAAALEAPLLFPHPRVAAEVGRLKPNRVHLIGGVTVTIPPSAETSSHDIPAALGETQAALGVSRSTPLPTRPDSSTIVETITAIEDGNRVASPSVPDTPTTAPPTSTIDVAEVVKGLSQEAASTHVWVVDGRDPVTVLLASAVGRSVDARVVAIDGADVLAHPSVGKVISEVGPGELRFVGPKPDAGDWQLNLLANGTQLPGGGFYILPSDQPRRYVAFYGHPETTALGALGEQGPEATLERMEPFLSAYTGDGAQTIPTFEMIASVASAGPTEDGDYSFEWPTSTFEAWIETARENDAYVILDLQPGREDFLSQAMFYQDLLELPFVGLALDPEWRLAPDQVHLEQVGRVEASEVNEVIQWLADLVRDNGLPQKLLIVHQFRTAMIQNREVLEQRPELQLVIQMDGDGTEAQKDNTWQTLQQGAEDAFWSWGWKNFFDEDEPGPPTPESTMSKVPSPVYVSYQ